MNESRYLTDPVLKLEDIAAIKKFYANFKVEMPKPLARIVERIEKANAISLEDQITFRKALAHSILASNHPLWKDPLLNTESGDGILVRSEADYLEVCIDEALSEAVSDDGSGDVGAT